MVPNSPKYRTKEVSDRSMSVLLVKIILFFTIENIRISHIFGRQVSIREQRTDLQRVGVVQGV